MKPWIDCFPKHELYEIALLRSGFVSSESLAYSEMGMEFCVQRSNSVGPSYKIK